MNKLENRLYNDLIELQDLEGSMSDDNKEIADYLLMAYYGSAYDKFICQLESVGIGSFEEWESLDDEDCFYYVLHCIDWLVRSKTLLNKFMNNLDK